MSNHKTNKDRKSLLSLIGLNSIDGPMWTQKWLNLKSSAKLRGLVCQLSFKEYVTLAVEAGLYSPSLIGRKEHLYQMGRIGDSGNYILGNCRFITKGMNTKERSSNGGDIRCLATKKLRTYEKVVRPQHLKELSRQYMIENNHMSGTPPWKNPRVTNNKLAIYAWYKADVMYRTYLAGGRCVKMARAIGMEDSTTHSSVAKKFKNGWIPYEDKDWLDFKEEYERVNR